MEKFPDCITPKAEDVLTYVPPVVFMKVTVVTNDPTRESFKMSTALVALVFV